MLRDIYCVQECVSELEREGNITVYIDKFVSNMFKESYCVEWCVCEVQCEGNITVYNDVCPRYKLTEMLLC